MRSTTATSVRRTVVGRWRGYSLAIVMLTLGLLTVGMLSLLALLHAGTVSTGDSLRQREVFYACDGVARVIGKVVSEYARTSTVGTVDDLRTFVEGRGGGPQLPALMPDGFRLKRYTITDFVRSADPVPVATGPFAGLPAREQRFNLIVEAGSADGETACRVDQQLAVSELGLFNFTVLAPNNGTEVRRKLTSQHADVAGHTYVRGVSYFRHNVCAAARKSELSPSTWFDRIISGELINKFNESDTIGLPMPNPADFCPFMIFEAEEAAKANFATAASVSSGAWTAAGPVSGAFVQADPWDVTGCDGVACTVDPTLALRMVPAQELTPPHPLFYGRYLLFQDNAGAVKQEDAGNRSGQKVSLRELLDEPDRRRPAALQPMMLAHKADLRIIDGVWYVRPAGDPLAWPGTAIWSDHPGVDASLPARGSLEVADRWGEHPQKQPRRFSYYGTDSATGRLSIDSDPDGSTLRAVVSYGALRRADGRLEPAPWAPTTSATEWAYCNPLALKSGENVPVNAFVPQCAGRWTIGDNLLQAARQGHFRPRGQTLNGEPGSMLHPVNIDLAALQEALQDQTPGELGSYFPPERPFNGIIYLTSNWPRIDGMAPPDRSSELPDSSPDIKGPGAIFTRPKKRTILPYPLCAPEETDLENGFGRKSHTLPACKSPQYGPLEILKAEDGTLRTINLTDGSAVRLARIAWPNTFRLINGGQLDPTKWPRGLTVASNLEITIAGDLNARSPPGDSVEHAKSLDAADPRGWMPVLVAADMVHVLPSYWPDENPGNTTTRIHAAVISGTPSGTPDALSALRLEHDWGSGSLVFRGSLVIGHLSEWSQTFDYRPLGTHPDDAAPPATLPGAPPLPVIRAPRTTDYGFDHRMAPPDRQPPGGSFISIAATRRWDRR